MIEQARAGTPVQPVTETVVFPPEVDIANVGDLQAELHTAIRPGVRAVIADLTRTHFCDSSGISALIAAHKQAAASGTELRVVTASPAVLRVMHFTGAGQMLSIYPGLATAVGPPAGQNGRRNGAENGLHKDERPPS